MIGILDGEGEFENEVGITTYLSSHEGIKGILKHRYSDFIVREVDKNDNIIYLNSLIDNQLENQIFGNQSDVINDINDINDIISNVNNEINQLDKVICIVDSNLLNDFLIKTINKEQTDELSNLIAYNCPDKLQRTSIHQIYKKYLNSFIDTTTVEVDNVSHIKLLVKSNKSNKRERFRWPANVGKFLQFTLMKENIDTMSAINTIARVLGVRDNTIAYSGAKDKRAITTQLCTIYQRKPSQLKKINQMKYPIIRVGDYKYVHEEVRLGNLNGNYFEIIIRNIKLPDDIITNICETISSTGFINYYGLQRFGKGGSYSHVIGKEILKGNYKSIVDLIFNAKSTDSDDIKESKILYFQSKFSESLLLLNNKLYIEKIILKSLIQSPNDYLNAYHKIPKYNRLICLHAYQSYLFNKAATERIRLYGLQCVEGDLISLVSIPDYDDEIDETILVNELDSNVDSKIDVQVDKKIKSESINTTANVTNNFQLQKYAKSTDIHILTKEDIESNKYTIYDIILPIPGSNVVFPTNAIAEYYHKLMSEDNISVSNYINCLPQYHTVGTYRRLLQLPKDFKYSIKYYNNNDEELETTELDKYREAANSSSNISNDIVVVNNESNESIKNDLKALQVKFMLPPGTYATMLLRELTKESTESQYQKQLTIEAANNNNT